MFFESALKGKNSWWRYLVIFLAAFAAANTIGALPLIAAIAVNAAADLSILDTSSGNIADMSVFGIEPNLALVLMIFPFVVGLITVALLMKPLHGRTFRSLINGVSSCRWSRVIISFLLWASLMAVYLVLNLKFDASNFTLHNTGNSLILLAVIALLLMPFQTTFEEVLFRGYLMQGLGVAARNKWFPLIVTSLLFGLMHAMNPEIKEFGFLTMMPQYISFGLLFGIISVLDNGIELAVGAHAANNIFLSIFVTQKASTLQTVAMFEQQTVHPWTEFLYLIIISLIFVGTLFIIYKWKLRESFTYKDL